MNDKEKITNFDALYKSMIKCQKGVMWKDSVAHFVLNSISEITKLEEDLRNGTYEPRKPKVFSVKHPKERKISSINFRDRIYQRSLNDNVLYPTMTRSFIFDNWACQSGKGTDHARERLEEFLHSYYRRYGSEGYVAQFDIHGYYPNMSHEAVEDMFKEKLDPEIFEMVQDALHSQYPDEVGYNAGSQMIQIAGISLLNKMDHYIKEKLRARYYIRYMDDFLIIHNDVEYLKRCVSEIKDLLNDLDFELNDKKTSIHHLSDGIPFLGFIFKLSDTGKVIKTISSQNVKNERKKLVRLVNKAKKGLASEEDVNTSFEGWKEHASKGNAYKLIHKMEEFYNSLWED